MRWFPLILTISLVYMGCGPHRPREETSEPTPGGTVLAYFDDFDLARVTARVTGPFVPGADPGLFERAPRASDAGPWLDAVRFIDPEGVDPAVLASLGQIDLGVFYGRDALRVIDAAHRTGGRTTRLPGWDRIYFLWLNPGPGRRWTRDPAFRSWLRDRLDRETLAAYLFGGEAVPADGLLPGIGEIGPFPETSWHVPSGTYPRISFTFDGGDPVAAALASRIKAVVEGAGVAVDLQRVETPRVTGWTLGAEVQAGLGVIRASVDDPVAALQEILQPLGEPVLDALEILDRANRERPGSAERAAAARKAERLVIDGNGPGRLRIVPLVRVHAWVFSAPGLMGVTRGDPAELSLTGAWWEP